MSAHSATSTLDTTGAAAERWDVAVIGAGPAGSVAALELARAGARVVVIDKRQFPRPKVCGDCLGATGVRTLRDLGLGHVLGAGRALAVDRVRLRCGSATLTASTGGMHAVSREHLDAALLGTAIDAGAHAVLATKAELTDDGAVCLHAPTGPVGVRAGAVVLACGLGGRTGGPTPRAHVARRSLIGVGVSRDPGPSAPAPGRLDMIVGRGGYVGRVRLADGRENWGAAIDPGATRRAGGVADAVRAILDSAGLDPGDVPAEGWVGTPALTRRRRVEAGRVVLAGDAAGYVEPITGEGMSWALATGRAVAPHALAIAHATHTPGAWATEHRRLTSASARRCAAVAAFVRRPTLLRAAMRSAGVVPASAVIVRTLIGAPAGGVA